MAEPGGEGLHEGTVGATDGGGTGGGLAEAHALYRRLAWFDLASDMHTGFRASYYRTFGVPRIARLLAQTGEIAAQPLRRAADTALLMYELIDAGPDAPRGREVLRMLNRMHSRWPIEVDDFLYVLCTFVVVPVRWIDQYGWRACTDAEREAIATFYREVGRRMGIRGLPGSYVDAARFLDEYEVANVRYSPEGAALAEATRGVLAGRLPTPLRPWAGRITALYLPDHLCAAVGIRPPARVTRRAFGAMMRVRGRVVRRRPVAGEPRFTPGEAVAGLYPSGYILENLGVKPR
jgi:hypothetical protein